MSDLLPFIVVGITTGSVYGLAAMGLVLTYKTSGIFNFAHGAVAAVAAYAFYELHVLHGLPWPIALFIAIVVLPPLVALLLERLTRALAQGTAITKIVATVGLQLAITSALVAHYGAVALPFPAFLPTDALELLGVNVGMDQLISAGVAAAGALGFYLYFKFSPMGARMRAVVDNPELLGLTGVNPVAVRRWSWLIGTWFAAISGVLLAPQIGLDALLLTLLVVQAYGAAAVGLFSSLPLTYAGGLLIGVLAALATNLFGGSELLSGLPPAIPFLVLFAVLLLAGKRRLVEPGTATTSVLAPLVTPRAAALLGVLAVSAALAVPLLVGPKLPVYANALVFVVIFYSLHLLVRTSGQVSLAHAALVAVGAAAFSHLAVGSGLPWLLAVLLGGVVAIPIGMIVAIPSIRLSGLFLALATFGFGLLMEKVLYRSGWMFGPNDSLPAPRPPLFENDVAFYYLLVAFAVGAAVLVAIIVRSRLGRLLRAMADAPTTLSTLGLGVNVTRVTVFAISAFLAGVAGGLMASLGNSATGASLTSFQSLTWLAVLVINSLLRSGAPIASAVALVVIPGYIDNPVVLHWLPVLFGLGAVLVAAQEAAHRPSAQRDTDEEHTSARAAERADTPGPIADRQRRAAQGAARPASSAVRIGTGVRVGVAKGGTR